MRVEAQGGMEVLDIPQVSKWRMGGTKDADDVLRRLNRYKKHGMPNDSSIFEK